ncbi:MAG: hypothetical protein IT307_00955 [Chloroflexi bacterium]|nr:hypothetical protein [Chloroflexota bacterium]
MALWKALRLQQGNQVGQAELANKASLARALERAAGEVTAGVREESLLAAAQTAYLGSWTEAGRRRKDAQALEAAADRGQERAQALEASLSAIEADVVASDSLMARIGDLTEHRDGHVESVQAHQRRVDALRDTEAIVASATERQTSATRAASEARGRAAARRERAEAVARMHAVVATLAQTADEDGHRLLGARTRAAEADAGLGAARAQRDLARARFNTATAHVARERARAELGSLEDRYARGRDANAAIAAARPDSRLPIDAARLAAIREQFQALMQARYQFDAAHPVVRLQAFADVQGMVDGVRLQLGPGRSIEQRLGQGITLEFPGVLWLGVSVGEVLDEQAMDLPGREARLGQLLAEVGARDPEDAEHLLARREAARRTIAEQRRILEAVLQGSTASALGARIEELRLEVDKPPMLAVTDPVAAQEALADAEQRMFAAEHEWQAAHGQLNELEVAAQGRATEARLAREELGRLEATLAAEREAWPDEAVETELRDAQAHEGALVQDLAAAREELAALAPDQAHELLGNAQRALTRMDRDARAAQDRLLEVRTRLRDHLEDGVEEDLADARMARDDAQDALRRDQSLADARQLLFETLRDERDRASRSYVGPLRREMERLGRIVFGPGFTVGLDGDTLEVVSRTLDGRTIPFESLSIGTQEQIAIIGRLACATIVAPDGGVPVILDDALGNSDKRRLEAMGAVLAAAGRGNQIIVLTCQPDRYEHVGDARVVALG